MSDENRLLQYGGLSAARIGPDQRRRLGNALMAEQYNRMTPQDSAVTDRASILPLGTYANGQTGIAWPGIIAQPFEQMNRILKGEITPGTPEFIEAGNDIAGAAMVGGLAAARPRGSLGSSGRPTEPPGIRGYHGSPHDFNAERLIRWPDGRTEYVVGSPNNLPEIPLGSVSVKDFPFGRFREDKVGTGEGAQAYGHGAAYIAEKEGVAGDYKRAADALNSALNDAAKKILAEHGGNKAAAIAAALKNSKYYSRFKPGTQERRWSDTWRKTADVIENPRPDTGRMYEVNIKANADDFLDWDRPLSQQSEKVRAAIASTPWGEPYVKSETLTGGQIVPRTKAGQQQLREAGIPGIRYLDQGSRAAGEGSRNYVVFDENLIEILRKYGLLGMLGAGGMVNELTKPTAPKMPDDAA